jgi:hypothetical protein
MFSSRDWSAASDKRQSIRNEGNDRTAGSGDGAQLHRLGDDKPRQRTVPRADARGGPPQAASIPAPDLGVGADQLSAAGAGSRRASRRKGLVGAPPAAFGRLFLWSLRPSNSNSSIRSNNHGRHPDLDPRQARGSRRIRQSRPERQNTLPQ